MKKPIVLITAFIVYCLSAFFSYSYFSIKSSNSIAENEKDFFSQVENTYAPPSQDKTKELFKGPKTEECPINGELLTKEEKLLWEKRRPLVVMIENHVDARPQSGLSQADVVYEAVAEGGITRFAAVFYCKDAPYIGPIRSARVYFIDFAAEYGNFPLYAHVGGANTPGPADALGKIVKMKWYLYNDLNQFAIPYPYFWRDYDRLPGRVTEHTMYSSTAKLWEFAANKRGLTDIDKKGERWDSTFIRWKFKEDSPRNKVNLLTFDFWEGKGAYTVTWQYDKKTNTYVRYHGSEKHIDKNTGKPIRAKNIVIAFMKESSANDGYEGGHLLYKTTPSGKMLLFQDGDVIEGIWTKKEITDRIQFYDNENNKLSLNRGQTFIEIVPDGNKVTY